MAKVVKVKIVVAGKAIRIQWYLQVLLAHLGKATMVEKVEREVMAKELPGLSPYQLFHL